MKVFYMLMTKTFLICNSMSTRTNEMHDIISENMVEILDSCLDNHYFFLMFVLFPLKVFEQHNIVLSDI